MVKSAVRRPLPAVPHLTANHLTLLLILNARTRLGGRQLSKAVGGNVMRRAVMDRERHDRSGNDGLRAVFLFAPSADRLWPFGRQSMEKLLLVIALACLPGDRLIDLSSKIPRGIGRWISLCPSNRFTRGFTFTSPASPIASNNVAVANLRGSYGYRSWTDASASDRARHK